MASQTEIRQKIASQIIEALQNDCPPWRRPWTDDAAGLPTNITGRRYSGINVFLLQMVASERGYSSNFFATFRQWQEKGFHVKKRPYHISPGHWGTKVVLFKPVTKLKKTDEGQEERDQFLVLREYTVFNAEQVDGCGIEKYLPRTRGTPSFPDFEPAERTIVATGADIRFGGTRAFYSPAEDFIQLPHKDSFLGLAEYYGVSFHELAHWTGNKNRLARESSYAFEELVAEIGGCYLATELGVPQSDDLTNHHAYLAGWLRELENDPKAIFKAATQASKVADYILSFRRENESSEVNEPMLVESVAD